VGTHLKQEKQFAIKTIEQVHEEVEKEIDRQIYCQLIQRCLDERDTL